MDERTVYAALLKRLTGEDVEIEYKQIIKHSDGYRWVVSNDRGSGCNHALRESAGEFVADIVQDILAYVNEPDAALDANAQELKRHYLALLEGK